MARRRKQPTYSPPAFHLETLERRILFSADAVLTALRSVFELGAQRIGTLDLLFRAGEIAHWCGALAPLNSATITATPLWRPLDPIPILARSDDDEPWYEKGMPGDAINLKAAKHDPYNQDVRNG